MFRPGFWERVSDVCWERRGLGVDSPILRLRGRSFKTGRARSEVHVDKCNAAAWESLVHAQPGLWSCRPLSCRRLLSRPELEMSVSRVPSEVHHPVGLENGFVEAPLVSFLLSGISSPQISPFSRVPILKAALVYSFKKMAGSHSNSIGFIYFSDCKQCFITSFLLLKA